MKTFAIVHRNIYLKVLCDVEFENVIKQHLLGSVKINSIITRVPTYTLVVTNSPYSTTGIYHQMIYRWFNYSTLDCWIDNTKKLCCISNFRADCVANRDLTIQYFVSNLFNRLLELNGYIGIHSSCVEKNGHGIMFIGNRLSGKTTCMLTLLNNGFNLVNNDTAAIKFLDNINQLDAFGITKNIFIRMSKAFAHQSINKKYLNLAKRQNVCFDDDIQLEKNRIVITPLDLIKLNNVELTPSINIDIVIVPRYNPNLSTIKFILLNNQFCSQFFASQIMPLVHDTTSFLSDIAISHQKLNSNQDCICQLAKLPCYLCEYNENTLENLEYALQNIIGSKKSI